MRWEMLPGFAPLREAVLRTPGRVVKESPAKVVTACEHGGRVYYLKRYRHASHLLRPLKFLWKRSQARQEWELAREFQARGIPTVGHLALGERWGWAGLKESILITEGFPGKPVEARTEVEGQEVVAFLSRMHQAGVIQHDLHAANLLRDPSTGEIRLVDLYGSAIKRRVSPLDQERNLAVLRMTLPIPVPPSVAALSRGMRKKALARRSKRAWKQNREFMPERMGNLAWQLRRPLCRPEAKSILEDPDGFMANRARILKAGRSATVGAADGYVLKRYRLKKPFNLVKDLFRKSRACRAFRMAYHLELAGIATARPVAAATRRRLGLATTSYFLMEEISGATPLSELRGEVTQAVGPVAALLARLHEEGFSHRDLKLTNLVFDRAGRVYLVDLEGLRFAGEISARRAWADLDRFWRSAHAVLPWNRGHVRGFLKRYCRQRGIPVRAVAGKTGV